MSTKDDTIEHLIERIIFLLKGYDCLDWVLVFKELLRDFNTKHKDEIVKKILSLYGGMGTFNDLVLQKDHKMPKEENDELDELREKLFNTCKSYSSFESISKQ